MGCYGIGVTRTLQAVIEQSHDEDGIIWPLSVSPYSVEVLVINAQHPESMRVAGEVAAALEQAGIDVLFDDRDERPGVKFKDADLLGIPIRINVGERSLAKGGVEIKLRKTKEMRTAPVAEVVQAIQACIQELSVEKEG
jgi:prolyl-tRNA synthetase